MDIFNESLDDLYRSSRKWTFPTFMAKITGKKPGDIVAYILIVLYLLMIFGVLETLICDILTFVFPARWTLMSISSPNFSSDKLWTTYWIIYSILKLIDEIFPFFLQFIPFYYAIKTSFLLVLYLPKIQGAIFLYNNVFAQLMKELKKIN